MQLSDITKGDPLDDVNYRDVYHLGRYVYKISEDPYYNLVEYEAYLRNKDITLPAPFRLPRFSLLHVEGVPVIRCRFIKGHFDNPCWGTMEQCTCGLDPCADEERLKVADILGIGDLHHKNIIVNRYKWIIDLDGE